MNAPITSGNAASTASPDPFRREVRDWLRAHFPETLKGHPALISGHDERIGPAEDHARWKRAMADKGWGAPTWPVEYGGAGLSADQADILVEELDRIGAFQPIMSMGQMMLGPTLLEFGTEEQKLRHLPPIARGEIDWCQGFSEPGAGSDLASLRLRCEAISDPVEGDHWLLNGQKIWTSYAHHSQWCFLLARTDTSTKHRGISFLLVDMATPGIEVRPIKLINGISHFCETFFTDVKVPRENLVGEVNAGWTIGKRLLQHERTGLSKLRGSKQQVHDVLAIARKYHETGADGRIVDGALRDRLADHLMTDHAYRLTLERRRDEAEAGQKPSTPVSTLKNIGAQIGQARGELAVELIGLNGLGWNGEGYAADDLELTSHWLHSKCYSIYGGSHEVQNNITARHELGLPSD